MAEMMASYTHTDIHRAGAIKFNVGVCRPPSVGCQCFHPGHCVCVRVQAGSSVSRTIQVVCPRATPFLCNGLCRALDCSIPDIAAAQPVVPNTPPTLHLLLTAPAGAAFLPADVGAKLTYYFPFGSPVATSQGGGLNFDVCPPSQGNATPTDCAAFSTDKVLSLLQPLLHVQLFPQMMHCHCYSHLHVNCYTAT